MKVAFLDRDGVINKDVNYLYKIEDFVYVPKAIIGMKKLQLLGYKLIIITNQAGIARGYYNENDYNILTDWMKNDLKNKGVCLLDVFHCPHHPDGVVKSLSISCNCRKPGIGMLQKASLKYSFDITSSILIGDKISDINAGLSYGIRNNFLVTTGKTSIGDYNNIPIFDSISDVSDYISMGLINEY